jgi:hypothetical protein
VSTPRSSSTVPGIIIDGDTDPGVVLRAGAMTDGDANGSLVVGIVVPFVDFRISLSMATLGLADTLQGFGGSTIVVNSAYSSRVTVDTIRARNLRVLWLSSIFRVLDFAETSYFAWKRDEMRNRWELVRITAEARQHIRSSICVSHSLSHTLTWSRSCSHVKTIRIFVVAVASIIVAAAGVYEVVALKLVLLTAAFATRCAYRIANQ